MGRGNKRDTRGDAVAIDERKRVT